MQKYSPSDTLISLDIFHISNLDLLYHSYKYLQEIRVYTKILTAFPSPYFLREGE